MSPQTIIMTSTESSQMICRLVRELVLQDSSDVAMSNSTKEVYCHLKRIVVDQMERNHTALTGMCRQISLEDERNEAPEVDRARLTRDQLKRIVDSVLADGCINWGRIVIIVAFCCQLAKYRYQENDQNEEVIREITDYLTECLNTDLREKILGLGDWGALPTAFPEEQPMESLVTRGLVCTLVGFGIASLAVLAAR